MHPFYLIINPIELPANRNYRKMFLFKTRACRLDDGKQRAEEEMLLLRALDFCFFYEKSRYMLE